METDLKLITVKEKETFKMAICSCINNQQISIDIVAAWVGLAQRTGQYHQTFPYHLIPASKNTQNVSMSRKLRLLARLEAIYLFTA